jgi:hypothetical protein
MIVTVTVEDKAGPVAAPETLEEHVGGEVVQSASGFSAPGGVNKFPPKPVNFPQLTQDAGAGISDAGGG